VINNKAVLRAQRKIERNKLIRRYRVLYLFLLPMICFYAIFHYMPLYGILLAFKDYWASKGVLGSPWVGLNNFRNIFESAKFWSVFANTFTINLMRLVFCFPAPVILAILLNEVRNSYFKRTIQTIIYLPHFISWVVIASILITILGSDGIINQLIIFFGGKSINFLTTNSLFRPIVILSSIWKDVGWGTIIYFAALSNISPDLYEAADVDGADRFVKMLKITLPSLFPTIATMLILNVGSIMTGGFDQIFNLYNPAVYESGDIIDTYIYRLGLTQGEFSNATAIGLFLNLINCAMLLTVNKVITKIRGYGIY